MANKKWNPQNIGCQHCNCKKELKKEIEELKKIRKGWNNQNKKVEFLRKLSEIDQKELKSILKAQKVVNELNKTRIKR
jgi:hypothetical protein